MDKKQIIPGAENLVRAKEIMDLSGKPTLATLLNQGNLYLLSKYLSLYPQCISHFSWKKYLFATETSTESYNQKTKRKQNVTVEPSLNWYIYKTTRAPKAES